MVQIHHFVRSKSAFPVFIMKLKWVANKIVERYGFQPKVRTWRYGMSLPLVRKIGPEDSIKTVTTQICLFHLFLAFMFYYYE